MKTAEASTVEPILVSVDDARAVLGGISRQSIDKLLDSGAIDSRYQGRRRYAVVTSLREYAEGLPAEPPVKEDA